MGKQWHNKCFTCSNPPCGKQLRVDNFTEKNGAPYCNDCYHHLFSPKCFGCKQPIIGVRFYLLCLAVSPTQSSWHKLKPLFLLQLQDVLKVNGQTWHPDHFSCSRCTRKLAPNDFKERDGNLYCPDCHADLFLPKCNGCRKPVTGVSI